MAERKVYQFTLSASGLRVRVDGDDILLRATCCDSELYDALQPEEGPAFEYGDTLFGELVVTQAHNTPIEEC